MKPKVNRDRKIKFNSTNFPSWFKTMEIVHGLSEATIKKIIKNS